MSSWSVDSDTCSTIEQSVWKWRVVDAMTFHGSAMIKFDWFFTKWWSFLPCKSCGVGWWWDNDPSTNNNLDVRTLSSNDVCSPWDVDFGRKRHWWVESKLLLVFMHIILPHKRTHISMNNSGQTLRIYRTPTRINGGEARKSTKLFWSWKQVACGVIPWCIVNGAMVIVINTWFLIRVVRALWNKQTHELIMYHQ